jgi:[ribosomal protein S5]-alanine N-acetyltransferase
MFETERLIIRKFTPEDLEKLIEMRSDPKVNIYLGGVQMQNPQSLEKRLRFYIACYAKYGFGMSAMHWKASNEMIGWSGLQPLGDTSEIEVGYGMTKEFWGKGIGFECARAWLEYGFNRAGLERIVAVAYPENKGSWRIMEKCGMKYEKTEKHYGANCVFYAVRRDEFFDKVKQVA